MTSTTMDVDVQRLLAHLPGRFVVVQADADLTVVGGSAALLRAVRPHAPAGAGASALTLEDAARALAIDPGELRASLERARATGQPDQRPARAAERHRRHTSTPIVTNDGAVAFIVHGVEEATAPGRVLLVEDEADLRECLSEVLGEYWEVEAAVDGAQALETAYRTPPDLVLTDLRMPRLDGAAFVRALRGDERTRGVPIVVMTAEAERSHFEVAEAAVDEWLCKPFDAGELVRRIRARIGAGLEEHPAGRAGLRAADDRLARLVVQVPIPMAVLLGADHVIAFANPALARSWGREPEDLVGRSIFEVSPEMGDHVWRGILDEVRETGHAYVGKQTRAREGEESYLDLVYAPYRDAEGRIEGVIVTGFDMTAEILVREELERLKETAEQATRAKDEFLAALGHELRNPLTPIVAALELMRGRGVAVPEHDVIQRQVGQLVRLVNDLLDVAGIAQGKVTLQRMRFELREVVDRALEMSGVLLRQRRQQVEVRVAEVGLRIDGDPERLAQVVDNLLTNAAKYSGEGTRIVVRATREGDRVRLSVRDQGVGIAPDMLGLIFDRYVQQPETLHRSRGGLGLGLSIVRSIVEQHGGHVEAHSAGLGQGSELVVELPALPLEDTAAPERAPDHTPLSTLAGQRVLVVEDNRDCADMLQHALKLLGHTVEVAMDARSAVDAARSLRPEVILVDIGLPGTDGFALAGNLREECAGPLRLIAVTGYGDEAYRVRAAAAGFDDHVTKPIDLAALARLVGNAGQRLVG
jgi:PAS domain S-box-containing protein